MSLFISDDEDSVPFKPSTETIAEEDSNDDEIILKKEKLVEDTRIEEDVDEDDPIVDSIPLYMNSVPERVKQSLHVLQYPGRPKTRPNRTPNCHTSIKPNSKYLQIKIPTDTSQFFDVDKVEDWGEQIADQTVLGVLDSTEEVGNYIAKVIDDGNHRRVVLIPVDSSVQLRSNFKYIDDLDAKKNQQRRQLEHSTEAPTNVQILQTAAKHSINSGEFLHALADSLKLVKRFDEEEWVNLTWKKGDDENSKALRKELIEGCDYYALESKTTYDEYIETIINN
ncbi:DNA-directed RNA polymerase III subunit RPC5 [Candida viswanathii]|uniref:DNA-directed RNA polymerase III subunit RPC5 n=1 Tax=Candida viswanathii TaxID=5486 RepID=A0A367YKG2_9ASCO|nr:DNA-directed RNA polymerase III subunit RPC5 [Candida viswanathii]